MVRWLAAACALVALLSGCDLNGGHHDQKHVDIATPEPDTIGVTATRITVGQGVVRFTVSLPSGGPGCTGRPQAVVKGYDAQAITIDTVVGTDLAATCRRTVSRTFSSRLDLQGRKLRVNGVLYRVDADGVSTTACDDRLGCDPPADRCDPRWTRSVVPHFDLPPAKSTTVVSCHAHWLVLDVTATANSGAVQHVRWFAELDPQRRWLVVASSRTGGCVDVRLAVPSFPLAYCRGLAAPT